MLSTDPESSEKAYQKEFTPDTRRSVRLMLKNIFLHPILFGRTLRKHDNLEDHFDEYAPRVSFGRSDHPLDDIGPMEGAFTVIPKLLFRKSESVLSVQLKERQGNRFVFEAKTLNIFKLMKPQNFYKHVYEYDENTPFKIRYLCIDVVRDDVYRVRLQSMSELDDTFTPMVVGDIGDTNCQVNLEEDERCYRLKTKKLDLHIFKEDFRIEVYDTNGKRITRSGGRTDNGFGIAFDAYPLGFIRDKRHKHWYAVESFELSHDESIYGLGEHFGRINKVGETLRLWIHEGTGNTSGRIYKSVPFFLSTRGYGVFFNQTHPMTFWIGTKEKSKVQVAVEEKRLDYYFFTGNIREILNSYTDLTGKAPALPKFSFGTWVSRMSYQTQEEVLEVAKTLRENRFPSDVIHIDVQWFTEGWRCDWQFDSATFPYPEEMCRQLHEQGFRVSIWQEPYVLKGTIPWKEAHQKDYLAKIKSPFVFVGQFEAAPIDFTKPEAARWYQQQLIKPLLEMGVDVIKTDFGEGLHPDMQFEGGNGHALHNVYPLLYQRAAYEITADVHGEENAMVWGRSAYAGSQRYPVQWSGDNAATFGSMQASLRGGLCYGLSGFTYWSQDTGGFTGEPADEVEIRWTQLSIFQSHMRYHGCYPFREPWVFSSEVQDIMREYLNVRYQLIPYLYSESIASAASGLPLLRAMVIDYQEDRNTHHIDDQFMCGSSILVAPIMRESHERAFYLPEGLWYEFWTKECVEGNRWITKEYDISRIPVWLRGGSVIPFGPVVQSTAELTDDTPLELVVLLDQKGEALYRFYQSKDRIVDITANSKSGQVTVNINGNMNLERVRVFGPKGEVADNNIAVKQEHI